MPKIVKKYGKITLILGLILVMVMTYVAIIPRAKAAGDAATLISDTVSDSRPGSSYTPNHVIKFKYATGTTVAEGNTQTVQFTGFTTGSTTTVNGDWEVAYSADGSSYTALTYTTHYTLGLPPVSTANPTLTITWVAAGATLVNANKYIRITLTNDSDQLPNPAASVCTITLSGTTNYATGTAKVAIIASVTVTATIAETLSFSIAGLNTGSVNGQAITAVSNTATAVPLGALAAGTQTVGAQTLTVATNATNGYTVTTQYTGALHSTTANHDLTDHTGTNAAPATMSAGVEAFGYTTDDSSLGTGTATRFTSSGGNKWAKFTTSPLEVAYSATAASEDTNIGYQADITATTPAGSDYTTTVIFVCTPIY